MAHHLPLISLIKLARKAQQENEQKHDVQLEFIDEDELPECPECGKPWHYGNDPCSFNPWKGGEND